MCAAVKRIGFVSTRFAGTDGVSLETFKWVQVLERNGFECYAFAGEMETPPEHSFPEPLAHFSHPEILAIHERLFGHMCRPPEVSRRIQEIKDYLKSRLYEFRRQYELDLLIPENVLAIPMHIPFGMAITEFLAETGMPCVAHHHDFSWERDRFIINCVEDYLSYAFPPALSNVRHVVINTAASRQLSYRRGISNLIIPNVFDFETEPKCRGDRCKALRDEVGLDDGDLFVLQPTRIVPRKQIERAIDLVALMQLKKPWLVISHESGDEGDLYVARILEYAERAGVKLVLIGDRVGGEHAFGGRHERPFSIDDVYLAADLVTYPSGYEGFGNAFLEAVYFKKPLVVNRYSIFVEDIEPKGFDVVSFEGFVTDTVARQVEAMLERDKLAEAVEKNYELGREFFSYETLEAKLLHLIGSL